MGSRPLRRLTCTLAALALAACGARAPDAERAPSPAAMRPYTAAGLMSEAGDHAEAARLYDDAAAADPDSTVVWLAAARARGRLGEWDAAVERARKARALAPDSPATAEALGEALIAAGRHDEALALYAAFAEAHPERGEAHAGRAALAEKKGDLDAAASAWERAVERAPERADWWARLGEVLHRQGRQAAAAAAFDRAATLDDDFRRLDPRTLMLALEGGDREVARRVAERAGGEDSAPGAGSMAIAALLLRRGDPLTAANELEWLLGQIPDHAGARLMLGRILLDVKRPDEALRHLERVPAGTRERADALRLRAAVALDRDDPDAAVRLLGEARAAGVSRPELISTLAVALRRAGRIAEARSELTMAVAEWPREVPLRFLLALMVHEMDGEDGALPFMQQVLDIEPEHPGALNYIGFTLAERNERLDEAEQMIRRALVTRPDDGSIVDSLGWVLFRQGRLQDALEQLDRAASLSPDEAEIHYHRGEVLRALGRRDEAIAAYATAIEKASDPEERARYQAASKKRGRR